MNYTISGGGRKKHKTLLIVLASILGVCVIGLYVLGLILDSDSEKRVVISEAVEENAQLRNELMEKDLRINELTATVNELEADIAELEEEVEENRQKRRAEEDEEETDETEETPEPERNSPRE